VFLCYGKEDPPNAFERLIAIERRISNSSAHEPDDPPFYGKLCGGSSFP